MTPSRMTPSQHRRSVWPASAGLAAAVSVVTALAAPAAGQGTAYLALGDSLAFGYETFDMALANAFAGTPAAFGDQGYAGLFADWLEAEGGQPVELINLGIPAEEASTFNGSPGLGILLNNTYGLLENEGVFQSQGALLATTLDDLAAAGTTVSHVSLHLGANDFFQATDQPGFFDLAESEQDLILAGVLDAVIDEMELIITNVLTAQPGAEVLVMGLYNPYAGRPDEPRAGPAEGFILIANDALEQLAADLDATFVEVFSAFDGLEAELTYILTDDTSGIPPLQSTSANVHPTPEGYELIFQQMVAAAIPAPGPVLLGGAVGLALAARRRR